MLEKVKNYVKKWDMLKSEDSVVVGVSGGADSICLLWVLKELQKECQFELIAVHVNHGLRGADADADEAYVKQFCAENNILCESYFANVELIAKNRKQSTEEAGREVRREIFERVINSHGGTKIALAHHQNDNAETFLIHLARGTGVKGLAGILPVNGNVIRPLLCVKREEIEEFLQAKGISYCEDQTNKSDEYTRNRVRNHVIPYLQEEINPKVIEHMNETMEQIRQVQDYLEEQVSVFWEPCVMERAKGYIILEEQYQSVPEAIKPLLLKRVLSHVSGREKDLEAVHVKQLQDLFGKQTGRKLNLPYQMEGKRVYQGISIYLKEEITPDMKEICFEFRGTEQVFRQGEMAIHCRVIERDKVIDKSLEKNNTKWFDYDIIKNNICIRTRRQGDYITIHPDGGTQKLKSYFINEKIPQEERDKIVLVADGSHVLWIVGYRVNPAYEAKANTNHVLEIQIDKGESYGRKN